MQDLYGNPLSGAKDFPLSIYQKRQAAILYHYASLDYLKGVIPLIDAVIDAYHGVSQIAQTQGRDALLTSKRWGVRDTSANADTHGTPFLSELRQGNLKAMANRAFEVYDQTTGFQYAYGGLRELSLAWMTDAEHEHYEKVWDEAYRYAAKIDYTLSRQSDWKDSLLVQEWLDFHDRFEPLPNFRVRTDVEAETNKKPPRTGVYISQDDPHGALQFAWAGGDYGALADCRTFNEIGLDALREIGRPDLWTDYSKIYHHVTSPRFSPTFSNEDGYALLDMDPEIAWELLSQKAFTKRPCKWYFVEMISGAFEPADSSTQNEPLRLRCEAGQPCPQAGWWFTPASPTSRRHFAAGETMPIVNPAYGTNIWQWDANQTGTT
jgi:hypothetical protein